MASSPIETLDLQALGLRQINAKLQTPDPQTSEHTWQITNPMGQHAIACGLSSPVSVEVEGHVGFYCAGMNKHATITVRGHAGVGLAENMMSGLVRVTGNVSQAAGATAHGGLLVIEGDASSRCGISMKGIDIVVGGSVGHMAAFMGQSGNLVVCGDAGDALGDSIYEARLFVAGSVESLGADCIEKEMTTEHETALADLLERSAINRSTKDFRRYGSARKLYNFDVDNADAY